MNKIYSSILVLSVAVAGTASAQKTQQPASRMVAAPSLDAPQPVGPAINGNRVTLWEDDFSDPSVWTIAHDAAFDLDWQIGVDLMNTGGFQTTPVASPSAGNGYAMIDSDGGNNSTGVAEASHMTAGPFSTAGYDNVVVEFQTFYRKWTNEECYIVVSTNNTDWPILDPNSTDGGAIPNVYEAFPGMAVQEVIDNPTRVRINVSDYAGNQPQVWLRFYWAGEWGYSWFVDDVKVIEQPAYELIMEDGYLSSTGDGEEYGRIPSQHLEANMQVGGNFSNFGVQTMTNVTVNMAVSGTNPFNATSTPLDLAGGELSLMDQSLALPNGGNLGSGMYNAVFTLSSNEAASEEDLLNNVYLRNFEVNPSWFSVDGIGNHPSGYQALGSLGTNSFTAAEDGLILFNYYPMAVTQMVYGVEVGITASSQAGSYFIVSIHDTTLVANILPTAMYSTDVIDVTASDVTNGKIQVAFDTPQTLAPGAYYIAITLYSNGGTNLLRVIDDLTVPEPGLTSGIQIPASTTVNSNGTAFYIRLATQDVVGVEELTALEGISLSPNPSNDGIITLRSTQAGSFNVEVTNMLGELVTSDRINANGTLDLRSATKGVYMVRVSNTTGSTVQRVTLN